MGDTARTVLVTGASGVVGGAVARALVAQGYRVVALQRGPVSDELRSLGVIEVRGDITDAQAVSRACTGVGTVVHAAARVEVTGEWAEFDRVNVRGTDTVLGLARAQGVSRFVFVSSPSVAHSGHPLMGAGADPAQPDQARSHYARSKAMAERAVLHCHAEGFATVAIRPHLVWGPGDTQLTERIVQRARAGRLPLIGSGAALIDTTYLDNVGTALAAAVARADLPEVGGRAFVVSNGEPRTVAEMLSRIALAGGAPAPRRAVPYPVARAGGLVAERIWARTGREGDPPMTAFVAEQLATAHWFDQRQTREALDWRPHVSLEEGFRRLAAWYADR